MLGEDPHPPTTPARPDLSPTRSLRNASAGGRCSAEAPHKDAAHRGAEEQRNLKLPAPRSSVGSPHAQAARLNDMCN